jgi:hypothetical protein
MALGGWRGAQTRSGLHALAELAPGGKRDPPRAPRRRPRVAAAKRAGALFLDDIGAETAKTDADFALGILREIIDARYRGEKPTWWTSNLAPEGILAAYGGRIASRLFDAWPDHAWLGLDLRLAQAPMIQQAISLVPGGRA